MSKKVISFYDSEKQSHDFPIITPDYGTCSTASNTSAKVVTCDDFSLFTGAEITVKFTNAPTTDTITLNVNNSGAKNVDFSACGNKPYDEIKANGCYGFVYDGTSWIYKGSGKGASKEELERLEYYGDKDIVPSDSSYFTVNSTGETITGLTDAGKTQTELVIPYKINGKEITALHSGVDTGRPQSILDGSITITNVTIPKSVTTLGRGAFYNCASLTSINIPSSITSIGEFAFQASPLTSIEIPNSVTSIGENAFAYCSPLTSIEIPNSVTSIGVAAFYRCSSLTSVSIPNSVTSIGDGAFEYCESLTSINIPSSVTSIGSGAFDSCTALTSISIPNSVTSIGVAAFNGCTALTSINIPNSVTSIGRYAFRGCTSLTSIDIPNSVTSIDEYAFHVYDSESDTNVPISGLTVYCEQGSYAETYANTNNIPVMYTDISATDFNNKADKATTISGYGITDAYTKTEVDTKLSTVYKVKGSSTIANLPTNPEVGDVYNVSDSGQVLSDWTFTQLGVEEPVSITWNSSTKVTIVFQSIDDMGTICYDILPKLNFLLVYISPVAVTERYKISSYEPSFPGSSIQVILENGSSWSTSGYEVTGFASKDNVKAGDNVVWIGHSWDKLSATIDLSGYQKKLTFDNTPTADSTNPVTSGGVKTALDSKLDKTAVVGKKTATGGETFNDYTNNKASTYSHAEGYDTAAGQMGHLITDDGWGDSTSKTYTLDSVAGLSVKDTVSMYPASSITNNVADIGGYSTIDDFAKITAINTSAKTITVNTYQPRASMYGIIYVKSKPFVGTIAIAAYSHAEGKGTKASGSYSHAEGAGTNATGYYSHAEGISTTASGSYGAHAEGNTTTASGTYSHAEGNSTKAYGSSSHAEGSATTASGNYSHAEGYNTITGTKAFVVDIANSSSTDKKYKLDSVTGLSTNDNIYLAHGSSISSLSLSSAMTITAIDTTNKTITVNTYTTSTDSENYIYVKDKSNIGTTIIAINANYSHAEGHSTIASGQYSHAEGQGTTASGEMSHAEGGNTKACGNNSHAEGSSTTASGSYGAHSEGYSTQAIGANSHAEGHGSMAFSDYGTHAEGYYTLALSASQHVQGKFNVGNPSGEYAHIVGNGSNSDNRSNAHTLDWNGNAWYQGDVKIGGTSYDDSAAKTLATQEYVDTKVAESGSSIVIDSKLSNTSTNAVQNKVIKQAIDLKAEQVELERLQYYGDTDIVPSDESYFTVNSTGETITGLSDTGKTQTELVIPYEIDGVKITKLNSGSSTSILDGNTVITKVVIPNSVTSIGSGAFAGCTSLTSINIPNSVTSIGLRAFKDCALTSINIPNSVTIIENLIFFNCTSLTSINIPNSVTSIGSRAFNNCTNLTIYCEQGSYAETYAKSKNIPIMYTDIDSSKYLTKDNTTEYTPAADYQPATKKYVDDAINASSGEAINASIVTSCTGDELSAITSPAMGSIRYVSAVGTGDNTSITPGLYFYLGSWKKVALEDTAIISNEFVSGGDSTSLNN